MHNEFGERTAWYDFAIRVFMWLHYADYKVVSLQGALNISEKLIIEVFGYVWTEERRMQIYRSLFLFEEKHVGA